MDEWIKCSSCQVNLHYGCTGLTESEIKKILPMNIKKWKCSKCKQTKKNPTSAAGTPKSPVVLNEGRDENVGHLPSIVSIDAAALLSSMDGRFQQMYQEMIEMKASFNEKLDKLTSSIQIWSNRFLELEQRCGELADFKEKAENKMIAQDRTNVYLQKYNTALEERIEMLEQKEKEKVVELACVEETENEKLDEVVLSIAQNLDLKVDDIEHVRRVGAPMGKTAGSEPGDRRRRARPIVVTMRTRAARDHWTSKRKTRLTNGAIYGNDHQQRIYINEGMTKYKRQLFWSAKNQLKPTYKYVWFQRSNVLVKKNEEEDKIYNIKNEEDIKSLIVHTDKTE